MELSSTGRVGIDVKLWLVLVSILLGYAVWQPESSCCCGVAQASFAVKACACDCGPQICQCPPNEKEFVLNTDLPPLVLSSGTHIPRRLSLGVDPAAEAYRSPRLAAPGSPNRRPRAPPAVLS